MIRISPSSASIRRCRPLSSAGARRDTQHFRWQRQPGLPFSRMELEMRGTVEFTDNDSDVKSISSDGYFRLEQWSSGPGPDLPGAARRSNGIERLYSVDGVSKALDADGRAWLGAHAAGGDSRIGHRARRNE